MKNETILVTGGAGYIGSITTKELIKNGFRVVVLDNLENGHQEAVDGEAILEVADLKDKRRVNQIFAKYSVKAVVDFAAYLAVGESMEMPEKYLKNNVYNFVNLLDAMAKNSCRYIVKSSTASVYGNPSSEKDFPLKETYTENYKPADSSLLSGRWNGVECSGNAFFKKIISAYNKHFQKRDELRLTKAEIDKLKIPTSVYGLTKLLDEIIMKKYDELFGIKSVALRYFNVAGADHSGKMGEDKPNPTNLMTVAIRSLLDSKTLTVFGNDYPTKDGTGIRDYIHVCDLAQGHIQALRYLFQSNDSGTFNLGTGNGFSVFEIIESVNKASKKEILFKIGKRRSGDPAISFADPKKANSILNWKTKLTVKDMSETAWKWHSSHPNGYEK